MTMRRLLTLSALVLTVFVTFGKTHYNTIHNRFGSLVAERCTVDGKFLVADNQGESPIFVMQRDSVAVPYSFTVRISNNHNNPRHSYSTSAGKVNNPRWGIVFDYVDPQNYCLVELRNHNTNLNDDATNRQSIQLTLIEVVGGHACRIDSCLVEKDIDMESGLNGIKVEVSSKSVTVSCGKKSLHKVLEAGKPSVSSIVRCGVYAGCGAQVAIERTILASEKVNLPQPTGWTVDSLNRHFEQSHDPFEGYWIYQDREMEQKKLRIGGRYTLAIVADGADGYDIIYVDGAQVRSSQWQTGLLKGKMRKTIFSDHYDLMWIDATFDPITEDAYATFENGVLLTLRFPVYSSQVRFSKKLDF